MMTSHFYDPSVKQNPLVSSSLTIGFGEIGKILANWATVSTDGKANIVLVVSNEVPPTMPLVAGFKSELAANCPNCKIVQEINVGVTEWGTKIQPAVQSAVQAHPEINVVIPIYDSMSQFVVPALRLTGKTGDGEGRRRSTARRSCWTSFSKAPSTWTSAKASTGLRMRRSTVTCATPAA